MRTVHTYVEVIAEDQLEGSSMFGANKSHVVFHAQRDAGAICRNISIKHTAPRLG